MRKIEILSLKIVVSNLILISLKKIYKQIKPRLLNLKRKPLNKKSRLCSVQLNHWVLVDLHQFHLLIWASNFNFKRHQPVLLLKLRIETSQQQSQNLLQLKAQRQQPLRRLQAQKWQLTTQEIRQRSQLKRLKSQKFLQNSQLVSRMQLSKHQSNQLHLQI